MTYLALSSKWFALFYHPYPLPLSLFLSAISVLFFPAPSTAIPAKAEIQIKADGYALYSGFFWQAWIPAFAGMAEIKSGDGGRENGEDGRGRM